MSEKKIRVYGALNEELEFKVKDRVGIIGAIFDNRYMSSCVLTFEDGMIMYARLNEIVDQVTNFISSFSTEDCKIIGTIYDKKGNR